MAKDRKEKKSTSGKKIQGSNKNILSKKKTGNKTSFGKDLKPKTFNKNKSYKSFQAAGADRKKKDDNSSRGEKKFSDKNFERPKKKLPFGTESKFAARKKNNREESDRSGTSSDKKARPALQENSFTESRKKKFVSGEKPKRFKETASVKPSAERTRPNAEKNSFSENKNKKFVSGEKLRRFKETASAKPWAERTKPDAEKNSFSENKKKKSARIEKPRDFKETASAKPWAGRDRPDAEENSFSENKKSARSEKPKRIKENTSAKPSPSGDQKKPDLKKSVDLSDGKIRLNRYISNAGICSRRDADKMIQEGLIRVNGEVITELGYKVNPEDSIKYGNKILKREKFVYILLNKPKDFITTVEDPEDRKTVMDLVKNACDERVYPVGRLDRNTTGLLLLTNDGGLTTKLSHPSNEVKKIYLVDLDKPLEEEDLQKIISGIELEDGPVTVDDIDIVSADRKSIGIEIHLGKNRIVRRIFEHLGYEVLLLDRVMYAGLTKKDLPRGKWRILSPKEVMQLKSF